MFPIRTLDVPDFGKVLILPGVRLPRCQLSEVKVRHGAFADEPAKLCGRESRRNTRDARHYYLCDRERQQSTHSLLIQIVGFHIELCRNVDIRNAGGRSGFLKEIRPRFEQPRLIRKWPQHSRTSKSPGLPQGSPHPNKIIMPSVAGDSQYYEGFESNVSRTDIQLPLIGEVLIVPRMKQTR